MNTQTHSTEAIAAFTEQVLAAIEERNLEPVQLLCETTKFHGEGREVVRCAPEHSVMSSLYARTDEGLDLHLADIVSPSTARETMFSVANELGIPYLDKSIFEDGIGRINTRLLERIKDAIAAHPYKLDMNRWISDTPHCGTTACIAGHAVLLQHGVSVEQENAYETIYDYWAKGEEDYISFTFWAEAEARKALGLTKDEAIDLFYAADWPEDFKEPFASMLSMEAEAELVLERIDYFLMYGE